MLKTLRIQNYVLIKSLEISPQKGLNTITGETGAGKSIMLGAIGLLLGNRADVKALLDENTKCVIEGEFQIEGYGLDSIFEDEDLDYEKVSIIRREISPAGKSRAFINDLPVRLDILKRVGEKLVDIHSQHQTLLLGDSNFQLNVVDAMAQNYELLTAYQKTFKIYSRKTQELARLESEASSSQKEADYKSFLLDELEKAKLTEGEDLELNKRDDFFSNIEDIKIALHNTDQGLNGEEFSVIAQYQNVVATLDGIKNMGEEYATLYDRAYSALQEISDIGSEIASLNESVEYDEQEATEVRNRLNTLNTLLQKHHVNSTDELLKIQENLQSEVADYSNIDDTIETLRSEIDKLYKEVNTQASELSDTRSKVFKNLEHQIKGDLIQLGMPDAVFQIVNKQVAPNLKGFDEIEFLFSANKGRKPESLKVAASGGEFSRLMFSLKHIIAGKTSLPTIIFDEIDTGISGEIAIKMGEMMIEMSKNHQIIVITHLPQIAAKGGSHYYVYKDNSSSKTYSSIRQLSEQERVEEIAQMIGGQKPSESAFVNAKELLAL